METHLKHLNYHYDRLKLGEFSPDLKTRSFENSTLVSNIRLYLNEIKKFTEKAEFTLDEAERLMRNLELLCMPKVKRFIKEYVEDREYGSITSFYRAVNKCISDLNEFLLKQIESPEEV